MEPRDVVSMAINTAGSLAMRQLEDPGIRDVQMIVGIHFSGPKDSWGELATWWAEEILQKSEDAGIDVEADNYTLLLIALPCGERLTIKTIDDMPHETIPCPCGDSGHYLVMYTEEEK